MEAMKEIEGETLMHKRDAEAFEALLSVLPLGDVMAIKEGRKATFIVGDDLGIYMDTGGFYDDLEERSGASIVATGMYTEKDGVKLIVDGSAAENAGIETDEMRAFNEAIKRTIETYFE